MTLATELESQLHERIRQIPIMEGLGLSIEELSEGCCKLRIPRKKGFDGIYDSLHGGLLMTGADTAACFAVLTMTGADAVMTTTDMNIRFLAPCLTDGIVVAKTIKVGKTMCPVHVDIYDEQETHVAVAQVNYMRLSQMPSR